MLFFGEILRETLLKTINQTILILKLLCKIDLKTKQNRINASVQFKYFEFILIIQIIYIVSFVKNYVDRI